MQEGIKICESCHKPIRGGYCYRHTIRNGEPYIEYYCNKCAACMVDGRSNNGLLFIFS